MDFNAALSGLQAATDDLGVISNNISNVGTTGFKGSRAEFSDVYANVAMGTAGRSIGSGVALSDVSQHFSQGQIEFTNNNLDLAINGQGFFVLSSGGSISYTRAGAFGVDKNGYLVNSLDARLQGYLADSAGNITGAQGDLQLTNKNLPPLKTSMLNVDVNLDATSLPPKSPFVTGFSQGNPPNPATFNSSTSTTIYDSLGNPHILTNYFVKEFQPNTWRVYVGIDGADVTPTPATPPVGVPPIPYLPGELPSPYTIVFDSAGNYIPNNSSSHPMYYGPGPVVSLPTALSDSGTLQPVALNALMLNGVTIAPSSLSSDVYSTTDNSASAIATVASINTSTEKHGVTASVNPTVCDLGMPTLGNLASGDFVINGQAIIGTVVTANDLLGLINGSTPMTGVISTLGAGGEIILTANDGRNIQLQTDGVGAAGATFTNFNLNGGVALNKVQRATVNLSTSGNQPIIVGGTNPNDVGLVSGPQAGIVQISSDTVNIPGWSPAGGASGPQLLSINFENSTQYGAPFSVLALDQNGYSTGQLSGVNIDSSGTLIAQYGNGQSLALGQLLLANFRDVQGLSPSGNTCWVESFLSGPALLGAPGTSNLGAIQSGGLEQSNVELTRELVNLITAQRNFQANAQSIKTADAITQTIINM